jgi:hypothetical protein
MKINFIYSNQYERSISNTDFWNKDLVAQQIKVLERYWKLYGHKVEKALKDVTGLKFKTKEIKCYLNSQFSISDPLSIKMQLDFDDLKETFVHELIHVLLTDNYVGVSKKKWDSFYKGKYQNETSLCRSHIAVHAIHLLVNRMLNPKREQMLITATKQEDYKRSWDIVFRDGPENIVEMFT